MFDCVVYVISGVNIYFLFVVILDMSGMGMFVNGSVGVILGVVSMVGMDEVLGGVLLIFILWLISRVNGGFGSDIGSEIGGLFFLFVSGIIGGLGVDFF